MSRILVLYATSEGQTRRIAQRLADQLTVGHVVEVCDIAQVDRDWQLNDYDAVIAGAPLHAGHHPRTLTRWIAGRVNDLNAMPSAFFSVSLSAAGNESQREDARRCLQAFLERTGWKPDATEIVAGAIAYRQYGFIKRWFIHRLVSKAYGPTDTSRDYEFTDWDGVKHFAHEFAAMLPRSMIAAEASC